MATCWQRLIVSFLVCWGVWPLASFATPEELTFVGSKYYPPLQWLDENNQPQGFIVELEQALANEGDYPITQTLLPWNEALQAVRTGRADAVALIPSEPRSEYFDFSDPFYHVAHGIFSRVGDIQYGNYTQLEGKKIAVAAGAFAEQQLRDSGYHFELISADDELHCLQLVDNQTADACIEGTTTSRHLITNNDLNVALSSPPFWPQSYAFGVRKGDKELLALINKQLAMIQVNGTYQNVYQRWVAQLEWQERTFASNLKALGWLLFGIVSIAAVGFGWSYALKKQVALKTYRIQQELDARKVLQKRLHYLAKHEGITGLYNRPAFTELLDRQIKTHPEDHPTVVVIRIVNIDSITSVFGYDITTELLIEFSERLKKQGFKYAAHFGVGLFAAVANAELSSEAIIDLASQPLEFKSIDFEPLLAFGLIRHSNFGFEQSNDAQELLRQALTAVSVSQKEHKLLVEYSPGLEPNADDLRLLKDFHQYGTRDFFLHYQPKLTLKTNTILGAEALVRWQHPTLGVVSPNKFIPLMEESGLVTQVTRWVITETIAMMKRHQLCQKGIVISVNVSTRDLTELGFVRFVQDIVTDIDPKCLQFEITETGLIDDSERALYVLSQMNELGISCSVDDFGTGNSSLSYLSKFPVAEIKLDRSYVFDIAENDRNYQIVRSSIELAHMLGISVTAEGVEDIATIDVLRELNCETIQGFVISRPISEDEIVEMFLREIKI